MELVGSNKLLKDALAMRRSNVLKWCLIALLLLCGISIVRRNWGRNAGNLAVGAPPGKADFIGTWHLDTKSFRLFSNSTNVVKPTSELTLMANGRFTAKEFPVEDVFATPRVRLKTGEGHWELYKNQYWVVDLGFLDGFGFPLDIRTKNGSVSALTFSAHDPDSDELWIWRKVTE